MQTETIYPLRYVTTPPSCISTHCHKVSNTPHPLPPLTTPSTRPVPHPLYLWCLPLYLPEPLLHTDLPLLLLAVTEAIGRHIKVGQANTFKSVGLHQYSGRAAGSTILCRPCIHIRLQLNWEFNHNPSHRPCLIQGLHLHYIRYASDEKLNHRSDLLPLEPFILLLILILRKLGGGRWGGGGGGVTDATTPPTVKFKPPPPSDH